MSRKKLLLQPLGKILHEADLISLPKLEVALRDQKDFPHLRLGEILALRGWLKQTTADFFVEKFPVLLGSDGTILIGQCFRQADLLNDQQIYTILLEQRVQPLRFGDLAVQKGWLRPRTVEFFADSLTQNQEDLESQLIQELRHILQSCQMNRQQRSLFQAALCQHAVLNPTEMEHIRKVHFHLSKGHIQLID
jgi:hypothetical protein